MNTATDDRDDEDDDRLLTLVRSVVAAVNEYEKNRSERPRRASGRSESRPQDDKK